MGCVITAEEHNIHVKYQERIKRCVITLTLNNFYFTKHIFDLNFQSKTVTETM